MNEEQKFNIVMALILGLVIIFVTVQMKSCEIERTRQGILTADDIRNSFRKVEL